MAIKSYQSRGKKLFEVYVNGFDRSGKRIQSRRKGIESLRKAEEAEFELKREFAKRKEQSVDPRWSEWIEECVSILKVQYRPSTLYSYENTLGKWIPDTWGDRDLSSFTPADIHALLYELIPTETTMHTRKHVLKVVKRIFQMGVDLGEIPKNPCHGIVVKVPEPEKKFSPIARWKPFYGKPKELSTGFTRSG